MTPADGDLIRLLLKSAPRLERLAWYTNSSMSAMRHFEDEELLKSAPSLKRLFVTTGLNMRSLPAHLTELEIVAQLSHLPLDAAAAICELKQLKRLSLEHIVLEEGALDGWGRHLPKLTSLTLLHPKGNGLYELPSLVSLEFLCLLNGPVADLQLSLLCKLKELELRHLRVSEATWEELSLLSLRRLFLDDVSLDGVASAGVRVGLLQLRNKIDAQILGDIECRRCTLHSSNLLQGRFRGSKSPVLYWPNYDLSIKRQNADHLF